MTQGPCRYYSFSSLYLLTTGKNNLARHSVRVQCEGAERGTSRGCRSRGRQKKKWEENIKEWTGMGFEDSQRAVENRERWR